MFWPTFWSFLVANAGMIDPAQVAPMIDFIQAIRHERTALETPDGLVELDPPQPAFSLKGRTLHSVLRSMEPWRRSLGVGSGSVAWTPSAFQPMMLEEPAQEAAAPPRRWQITELTNSALLRTEGTALHHCFASYAHRCCRGASRIWSLRVWRGESVQHVLTMEVDPKRRAVVQARGRANRAPSGKPLQLLRHWAARERLQLEI